MSRGREANLREKLAACLLMLKRGNGEPLLPITRKQAKTMTPAEIIAMVQFHHVIGKRFEGSNHPTNLDPQLKADHQKFEAEVGSKQIAKTRRYERLQRTGTKRTKAQQRTHRPMQGRRFPTPEERRAFLERVVK